MNKSKIISKIQTIFGITNSEVIFVVLIFSGLTIGLIIQLFRDDDFDARTKQNEKILKFLDSVSEAEKSTYVGSDLKGNSFPEHQIADTIIKKSDYYPFSEDKKVLNENEKINLKTASLTELMKLPGIGRKTAEKIIELRDKRQFRKTSDLKLVPGIGDKKYEKILPHIIVE